MTTNRVSQDITMHVREKEPFVLSAWDDFTLSQRFDHCGSLQPKFIYGEELLEDGILYEYNEADGLILFWP